MKFFKLKVPILFFTLMGPDTRSIGPCAGCYEVWKRKKLKVVNTNAYIFEIEKYNYIPLIEG